MDDDHPLRSYIWFHSVHKPVKIMNHILISAAIDQTPHSDYLSF
jgi:hypothetical protein